MGGVRELCSAVQCGAVSKWVLVCSSLCHMQVEWDAQSISHSHAAPSSPAGSATVEPRRKSACTPTHLNKVLGCIAAIAK